MAPFRSPGSQKINREATDTASHGLDRVVTPVTSRDPLDRLFSGGARALVLALRGPLGVGQRWRGVLTYMKGLGNV